jgi:hypothetical protein
MTYNYGAEHELEIGGSNSAAINWPQSFEVGLQYPLSTIA